MPWWGRSSDPDPDPKSAPKDFSDGSASDFSTGPDFSSSDIGGAVAAGGGGGIADIQQFSMALQSQIAVQKAITEMTDLAFEKCITGKPGDSLGSKETNCVHSTVNKWLDTNEFMIRRLQKKQQAQLGSLG